MKRKIYKLVSSAKQGLFVLALTVFSGTAYSQTTYTFNYTGITQTISLPAGNYSIECWGADGGNATNGTTPMFGGKGGYSSGVYNNPTTATLNVYVGGRGGNASGANIGGGGGGMSDVTAATNTNVVIIAAGGGGGGTSGTASEWSTGGDGGGLTGGTAIDGTGVSTGTAATGGSQTAGGFAVAGSYGAGTPGGYGYGGGGANGGVAGVMHSAGGAGGNGGTGGWNGGGGGCTLTGGNDHAAGGGAGYYGGGGGRGDGGAGGGGSGYIGGVTSGVITMTGQAGFVINTDVTGNGLVLIKELCNISLTASGSNSLQPSICAGQSVSLTTDGISNYAWSTGNTTNSTIVVSPAVTTVYTLSATSPSNCTASKSITVTVSPALPVLTITNTPNSMCLGTTATLTAGGALTYTWTGGVQNGQSFTPNATSGYTVTGQNGCGQSTASTTITIVPLAVSVATSSNNICAGNTAVLTATAAVTGFTWMPGSLTGTNVLVSPTVNTVYTLTASDGTCSGVATLSLDTKPIPTLAVVASATDVCEGAAVTLTVTGANTYTWSTPVSNASIITVNPASATSYVVVGTNGVNCTAAATQIVVTKPNPVVNVSTNKSLVCVDGAATLTASGGSTSYAWISGPATATNVVNPSVNSTYTVTGTGANGCTTDKTITVNVLTVSVSATSASTSICYGSSAVLIASGATTYTWVGFGNFANTTVSPTVTTTYSVNASTTSQGLSCPSSNTIIITVNALPTVSVSATKTVVCRKDENVVLTADGASTYVWGPAQTTNTISVHPQATTTYSVTGADANGCQGGATLQIVVNPCTGIEEVSGAKTISVYPNPSNGEFTVSCDSDINLKVINELGQLIQTITLNIQNNHKVSVNGLANGVYFIVGQNNTEKVNQKIIVNK